MSNNEFMKVYNLARTVPKEAQKPIAAGRLKGMTDINPMWRIQMLTEIFGMAGIGWKYVITDKRIEEGASGVKCAFVDIDLFVRIEGEWSDAIQGTGGSAFVAQEKSGLYTSDECFKMALTDAISVACKALGFGADVYWASGRSKYDSVPDEAPSQTKPQNTKPAKQPTPRERLIAKLKALGVDLNEYATAYNVTPKTTDEEFEALLKDLER